MKVDQDIDYSVVIFVTYGDRQHGIHIIFLENEAQQLRLLSGRTQPGEIEETKVIVRILREQLGLREIRLEQLHPLGVEQREIKKLVRGKTVSHSYPVLIFQVIIEYEQFLAHGAFPSGFGVEELSLTSARTSKRIIPEHARLLSIYASDLSTEETLIGAPD